MIVIIESGEYSDKDIVCVVEGDPDEIRREIIKWSEAERDRMLIWHREFEGENSRWEEFQKKYPKIFFREWMKSKGMKLKELNFETVNIDFHDVEPAWSIIQNEQVVVEGEKVKIAKNAKLEPTKKIIEKLIELRTKKNVEIDMSETENINPHLFVELRKLKSFSGAKCKVSDAIRQLSKTLNMDWDK